MSSLYGPHQTSLQRSHRCAAYITGMQIFDDTQHPRATDGTFTKRFHTAPEATLATERRDAPYTFLTEDEIRDALPSLRAAHGFPAASTLGYESVYRTDDVHEWLTSHPALQEEFRAPEVAVSEYEIVDADGVTHCFPLTTAQITAVVGAAQDLCTQPSDVVARLAVAMGIAGPLALSDGTLTSDDPDHYPWVSPFMAALDPEYMKLTLDDFIALNRGRGW
jgi:hypothetical protein